MILKHIPKKNLLLLSGDVILIVLSMACALYIRTGATINILSYLTGASTFTVMVFLPTFYIFDLYKPDCRFKALNYLSRLMLAAAVGGIVLGMVFYILPTWQFGRGTFIFSVLLIAVFTYSWRMFFESCISTAGIKKNVIIIGAGGAGQTMYDLINGNSDYRIIGFLDDDPELRGVCVVQHRILGDCSRLIDMANRKEIDVAVIAVTHGKKPELYRNALAIKMKGIEVYDVPSLYEKIAEKVPINCIKDSWFVYVPLLGVGNSLYTQKLERFMDIAISGFGLIFSLPINLITAILIKLESKGPIFYTQERIGQEGKHFKLVKFRSMKIGAELNGATWAEENDTRVTRVGKIIRKLRIDEIPQMWNVLKGDISFIGPRPERPEFLKSLEKDIPYYSLRHSVKPGITGWAQINYGYGASKDGAFEKLQYDFFYIKNKSLLLDLIILLRTVRVVLFGSGAR
ncbi:MAG: TIGR03013 family XrtA/PEP-CTERM system glycosyltransferase [Candidatus Scalinduaceae bacterium]